MSRSHGSRAGQPQELTRKDEAFLNFIEQMWSAHGTIPSKDLCEQYGFTEQQYGDLVRRKDYRANLVARGVNETALPVNNRGTPARRLQPLTETQLTAVDVMLDIHDRRSKSKRLSELGISTAEWGRWLKDPGFVEYFNKRGGNLLEQNKAEADFALVQKARTGDISAIKYFDERTGRYVPPASGNGGSGNNTNFDARAFVIRVMEAVQKHTSPDQQQRIADELLGYAQTAGFASKVMDTLEPISIPVPESYNGSLAPAIANAQLAQPEVIHQQQKFASGARQHNPSSNPSSNPTRDYVLEQLRKPQNNTESAGGL